MTNEYYTEIAFLIIFSLVIMIVVVNNNHLISKQKKIDLRRCYITLILITCCEWLGIHLSGRPNNMIYLHFLAKALKHSLMPYFCIKFMIIIDKVNIWFYRIIVVNAILQFSSIFTNAFFYINESNYCINGPLYNLYSLFCFVCACYTMYKCYRYGERFQSNSKKMAISLILLLLSGMLLREINSNFGLELLSISYIAIFLYIYYIDILQKSDALTGLLNRGSYINKLSDHSNEAAIIYFDIDDFKNINDHYGHLYGDKVLQIVGRIIKEVYGRYGSCYRIGGDEFSVIIEDRIDKTDELNKSFKEAIANAMNLEEHMPNVSVGFAQYDAKLNTMEDALDLADKNMYRTKTKLKKALAETNKKLHSTIQAFQIAAEETANLVFIYDLSNQTIIIDEKTAKNFGINEIQSGVPYHMIDAGIISSDTIDEYIRLHEAMLNGAPKASGIIKLIQSDGSQSTQRLAFRAVYDEDGKPTDTAVGVYTLIQSE